MEAWLVYDKCRMERNINYINIYFEECKKRNVRLKLMLVEDIEFGIVDNKCTLFYKNKRCSMPQFVIVRTINPLLTKHFELMGVPVFNDSFVSSICNDKQKTYQYVSNTNIEIMDTSFAYKGCCNSIKYPSIIKSSFGCGGKNVFMVKNQNEFEKAIKSFPENNIIIQKPASDLGKDLRVYVLGDKIIASILRVSNSDFRSNYSLGGSVRVYNLGQKEKSIIYKIIEMFDFGLVGIDFVFDKGKIVFNEIEDVVGARMLYSITDINIVSLYLDFILSKI
ncbi:ATP-grasp domain-containing protein [Herbivorax sp. ANBcel31]|uniref:ATP-grasp domain-containing protein n=1 Tax=Herbivorax sp. ANBcel31 TaxID=3069754 RepID=UPI0027B2502F|nr:ATP-grasp domain-containing protein [Herbivorax sp. ANBcel31]MDQ2087014.1 ATP-grasp domain-containing protein [Herbivorax sp. ANBcel31]